METSVAIHNKEYKHLNISPGKSLYKQGNKHYQQQQNNKKQQQNLGMFAGREVI